MRYIFIVCFFTSSIFAQSLSSEIDIYKKLPKDSLIGDFVVLNQLITELHPGAYLHCSSDKFEHFYDSLLVTINKDLTIVEFYSMVALLTAKVKDGHTWVDNWPIKNAFDQKTIFPFNLYSIKDSVYVNQVGAKELNEWKGTRIISINYRSIKDIIGQITPTLNIEGNNTSSINYALRDFPFYYYLIDSSGIFNIQYLDKENQVKNAIINGINYKNFRKEVRRIVAPITKEFIDDKVGILTVNTFNIGDFEYMEIEYKKYLDDFFSELSKRNINELVIDLRGNGGGSAEISNYLFAYLTSQPYYYFDYVGWKLSNLSKFKSICTTPEYLNDIDTNRLGRKNGLYIETETPKKDNWWFEKQQGKKKCFTGHVTTIIDGGCFSTTGHFIALLRNNRIGRIVGECSHGSYYSNDGGLMFRLPHSKLEVRIPFAQFRMRMPLFEYNTQGICPDIEILKAPEELRTGDDGILNLIIKDIVDKN
jgi:hypothetical protein